MSGMGSLAFTGTTSWTCSLPRAAPRSQRTLLLPPPRPPPRGPISSCIPLPCLSVSRLPLGHSLPRMGCQQEGFQSPCATGFPMMPWEPGEVPGGAPSTGRGSPWAPSSTAAREAQLGLCFLQQNPMLLFEPRSLSEGQKAIQPHSGMTPSAGSAPSKRPVLTPYPLSRTPCSPCCHLADIYGATCVHQRAERALWAKPIKLPCRKSCLPDGFCCPSLNLVYLHYLRPSRQRRARPGSLHVGRWGCLPLVPGPSAPAHALPGCVLRCPLGNAATPPPGAMLPAWAMSAPCKVGSGIYSRRGHGSFSP